jgi:prolyl-tRNA synthetase
MASEDHLNRNDGRRCPKWSGKLETWRTFEVKLVGHLGTKDQVLMEFFVNRAKIDEETLKPAVPGKDGVTPANHKNYDLNYKLWCTISACVDEDNPRFRSVEMN